MSSTSLSSVLPPPNAEEHTGPRILTPTTNSIPLIQLINIRKYAAVHTVVVAVLFVAQFRALVAKPNLIMALGLVPLMLLQSAYCVVCLPPRGTWANTTSGGSTEGAGGGGIIKSSKGSGTGSLRKRPAGLGRGGASSLRDWKGKVTPTLIALALSLLIPPVPLLALASVLGAPLYPVGHIYSTTILSFHISLLTSLPLFYTHGVSGPAWRDIMAAWLPFDEAGVWGGSVGCFVGGWLGAIPMALDWDRDWQAWPVTVLTGCYGGWAVGKTLLGPVFLRQRRIDMSVSRDTDAFGAHQEVKKSDQKSR